MCAFLFLSLAPELFGLIGSDQCIDELVQVSVDDGIDVKIIQGGKTNKEIDGLLSDIQQLDIKKKEIDLGETAELFLNLKDLEQEEKVIKAKLEKKKHSKNVYKEKINTEEEKKKSNEKVKKKIDLDATCEYVFAFNKNKKQ